MRHHRIGCDVGSWAPTEQFFDLANGYANLTPLRAHYEETVRGW